MSNHAAPRRAARVVSRQSRMWKALVSAQVRAVLSLGVVLGVGATGTYAYWTDDVTVTGATFTTGNLDLLINADPDDNVAFTSISLSGMSPGSTAAGVLTVKNNGTTAFKYTATSEATNADGKNLAAGLTVKVTGAAAISGSGQASTCGGAALAGTGSTLSGGIVATGRLLNAGVTETLCVQVTLPTTAGNGLQDATTTATLTFAATSDLS